MNEQKTEREELLSKEPETQSVEDTAVDIGTAEDVVVPAKTKMDRKKLAVIIAAAAVIIVVAIVLLLPSKFEKVKSECVHIAGMVTGSGDYFMIDTYPEEYENLDEPVRSLLLSDAQDRALEAIQYANEELGFNGSVYSRMLETSARMGRQSEENDKYKVSWTYHPDEGLEVTYEKK